MRTYPGKVREMRIDSSGQKSMWISCPKQAIPPPGCYVIATYTGAILAPPIFLERVTEDGFLAAPPIPPELELGATLLLRGPLGRGFKLPSLTRRLALAAFDLSAARLLPLAQQAIQMGAEVALYCDSPLPGLPSAIESAPLSAMPEALDWADFLAVDIPLEQLPLLRDRLERREYEFLNLLGQVLVFAPMPCAGVAECGACAVKTGRGWKLCCKDGPVFDLRQMLNV
jgi:Iron-sulfur cluster binding domain of dihydroorotate dehydrogenase B